MLRITSSPLLFWVIIVFILDNSFGYQGYGQKESVVWYFGGKAGLDFNLQYPRPLTEGQINTREGVATICDKDGNILFYTDGQTVYNRNHDIMQDGEGLFGDVSSTQSSIIVPKPGSATEFYIFTVDQAVETYSPSYKGLNYSIVDMHQEASLGRVTQKNTPLPDAANILFTEKITVVKNSEGNYWIIAHEFGSAKFFEFLLTNSGITLKYTASAGSKHPIDPADRGNRNATGYLKSSPKGDFLVTAMEGLKFFELFSFNNNSGAIELIAKLPAGDTQNPLNAENAAYGVEFSPTSNFLYGSTRKGGFLYQWDLSVLDQNSIRNSVQFLREQSMVLCGALQLGLNGKIYVSLSGQPFLGVINSPIQKDCHYVEHGASLMNNATGEGGKAYFGLPTFLSDFFRAAQFYYENTCQNDLTRFYLSANKGTIEGFPSWTIFNAGTIQIGQADVNPETMEGTFRFTRPGNYLVKFQVTQFGGLIKQDQVITIHPLPELSFPDTTSVCKGSPVRLDAGNGAFYSWRDNQNLSVERYRSINNPGKYVVTVTHYNGCSYTDSTLVAEKPLPVITDTIITLAFCGAANGSITLKMEEGDQYDFSWDHDPDNTCNQALNLAFGVYIVKITSRQTGCLLTSKHSVSEEWTPNVLVRSSVSGAVCPGTKVKLTAEGAPNYQWENPFGIQAAIDVTPAETTTYRVKGYSYDQVTHDTCSAFGEITVEVFKVTISSTSDLIFPGQPVQLSAHGAMRYEWIYPHGLTSDTIIVNPCEETTYLVVGFNSAIDSTACSDTSAMTIKMKPNGPDWTLLSANLPYGQIVTAKVFINQLPVSIGYGKIGAFNGDECCGLKVGAEVGPDGSFLFTFPVFSSQLSGTVIGFKYWDPLKDTVYEIFEKVTFNFGDNVGSPSSPFSMNGYDQIKSSRLLAPGWNWFSLNIKKPAMFIDNILSSLNKRERDLIKSQFSSATYYPEYGWFGDLTEISPDQTYKIHLGAPGYLSYQGYPAMAEQNSIPIKKGWNWMGYPPSNPMNINQALESMVPEEGDYIESRMQSAMYFNDVGWYGGLASLEPLQGYMLKTDHDANLTYPNGGSSVRLLASNHELKTGLLVNPYFNPYLYKFTGNIAISVNKDGQNIGNEENDLIALINGIPCGMSKGMLFPPTNAIVYNLIVYSNVESGELIQFKFYEKKNDNWLVYSESVEFYSDMILGNALQPYILRNYTSDVTAPDENPTSLTIYPNPSDGRVVITYQNRKPGKIEALLCDIFGRVVQDLSNRFNETNGISFELDLSGVASGVYFMIISGDRSVKYPIIIR